MKTILRLSLIVCLAFFSRMGAAQEVATPVMTYVTDNAGGLHAVLGIPAAASVGAAMNVGFGINKAAISPMHDYLLAMTNESTWPVLVQLRGNNVSSQSMQRGDAGIDAVELSPTGSAAGLFSWSKGRIYSFRNLSQSPVFAGEFEVGALGHVTAFGISDSGQTIMFATSDGAAGSLFYMNVNEGPQLVGSLGHASAIEFLRHSNAAVVADDADNKVYGFAGGQFFPIATEKDGISTPVSIAVAADNSRAFVVNGGSQSVTRIGPDGVVAEPVPCACTMTGLYPTSTDSVFRVTDFSGGPIVLFDGGSRVPRMLFVPAGSQN